MVQLSQLAQVDLVILVGLVHHQDPVGHHFLVDHQHQDFQELQWVQHFQVDLFHLVLQGLQLAQVDLDHLFVLQVQEVLGVLGYLVHQGPQVYQVGHQALDHHLFHFHHQLQEYQDHQDHRYLPYLLLGQGAQVDLMFLVYQDFL